MLSLIDGEAIVIESVADPAKCYRADYLDMVVVPASLGAYVVRNLGRQPAVVHKTRLKHA